MSNGRIVYGSTTYDFPRNYIKEPSTVLTPEMISRRTTDGTLRKKIIYSLRSFSLTFQSVTATQKAALEAAAAYSGPVEFFPDGVTGDHYINGDWKETGCVPLNSGKYDMSFFYEGSLST